MPVHPGGSEDTRARIKSTLPGNGGTLRSTSLPVVVTFTRALDSTVTFTDYITAYNTDTKSVVPITSIEYSAGKFELEIRAGWEGSTNYLIVINQRLPSAFGQPLGEQFSLRFKTGAQEIYNPVVLSPSDGTTFLIPPTLTWMAASGATLHEVAISKYPTFDTVHHMATIGTLGTKDMVLQVPLATSSLDFGNIYYWKVRGVGSEWTDAQDFYYGELNPQTSGEGLFITWIEPQDKSLLTSISRVTIHLSGPPSTPASTYATVDGSLVTVYTRDYWRTRSSIGEPFSEDINWYGTWEVDGNSLVWIPSSPTLATFTQYDLYLNGLSDVFGQSLDWNPGEPVYSITGPYSPSLIDARYFGIDIPEAIAGYYLWLGSKRVNDITLGDPNFYHTVISESGEVSTIETEQVIRAKQRYAIIYGLLAYKRAEIGGLIDISLGGSVRLSDYSMNISSNILDFFDKYTEMLEKELQEIEDFLMGRAFKALGGTKSSGWDPVKNLPNDKSYYGAGISRTFHLEDDSKWTGWRPWPGK